MLFNSFEYVAFLGVVYCLYRVLPLRGQNVMLLAASYFFYGSWDWRFLSLILISTLVDYYVGARMHASECARTRRRLLALSVSVNLGILGFFKYYNFFADSMATLLAGVGISADPRLLDIVLPVGISFYTFQTMTYSIDIYRRQLEPTRDFLNFALFVAFFPQLVAGPIERARNLLPQIQGQREVTAARSVEGLWLIAWGLFKKVVIADNVAAIVDTVFANPHATGPEVIVASYAFAVQIYCDFSGYSDIARGSAKLLGFELMLNFRIPFVASSPADFWRRWHISLSTWLRDYLYISLGGNRAGTLRTYRNLMITMVLGGLWHGAAWTFVVWGFYQGALLALHRALSPSIARVLGSGRSVHLISVLVTFQLMAYGWLVFRAQSFEQLAAMSGALLASWSDSGAAGRLALDLLAWSWPLLAMQAFQLRRGDLVAFLELRPAIRTTGIAAMAYMMFVYGVMDTTQFIYFQF